MTQSSSSITNSRLCNYGCNTQIYWNNSKRAFVEVETGKKHFCQSSARTKPSNTQGHTNVVLPSNTNRPTFTTGSGKPFIQQTKQPTKNSIQVLKGTEQEVQKQYEKLSDIIAELSGRIHGSQSHYLNNGELRIVVYYEVPATGSTGAENRELVKSKFS